MHPTFSLPQLLAEQAVSTLIECLLNLSLRAPMFVSPQLREKLTDNFARNWCRFIVANGPLEGSSDVFVFASIKLSKLIRSVDDVLLADEFAFVYPTRLKRA